MRAYQDHTKPQVRAFQRLILVRQMVDLQRDLGTSWYVAWNALTCAGTRLVRGTYQPQPIKRHGWYAGGGASEAPPRPSAPCRGSNSNFQTSPRASAERLGEVAK